MITCHFFSWALHFNFDWYNATIIEISIYDFYFNKNILTQLKYDIPAGIFQICIEQNKKYIHYSKKASNDSNICTSIPVW